MAKAIHSSDSLIQTASLRQPLRVLYRLRLGLGSTVLLGSILFLLGGSWDIEWHTVIGRDRTLIPPHQLMLLGIALSGIAALLSVLIETFLARRSQEVVANSTSFANLFYGPIGAYLAGFAALSAGIGFTLDSYWHALYGIDVAIWAPFHIMLIVGSGMASLGAAYMLISAAHLAERTGDNLAGVVRACYIGATISFAMMLGILAILLLDAYGELGYVSLGFLTFNLFSVIAATVGMWILLTAVKVLPWRWSASYCIIVYMVFVVIVILFVPPAIRQLAQSEQLSFRRAQHIIPTVASAWPIGIIYSAILLDVLRRRAQVKNWSARKFTLLTALITLPGWLPIALTIPYIFIGIVFNAGVAGLIVSTLLGLAGSFVGIWLGQRTGESFFEPEGVAVDA